MSLLPPMRPLPIGTQSFARLREGGFVYVDKTAGIHRMLQEGRVYFLSRPRRFGKSLLVSTLRAIFEGRRELFKGLAIDGLPWDWRPGQVLHLDFSSVPLPNPDAMDHFLCAEIARQAAGWGVTWKINPATGAAALRTAVLGAHSQGLGPVAVLIDEYDKPILDHILQPELALPMREALRGFYTSLKSADEWIRFVLLTGITKFAKMSVFSGLNNLNDITMDEAYATLLGYTQFELEASFPDRIDALSERLGLKREACLAEIREWYNGYRFAEGAEPVYNPFSTLLLFNKRAFGNYWYETGTPTFLLRMLRDGATPNPEALSAGIECAEEEFTAFQPEQLAALPLLFQAGYLTLAGRSTSGDYRLSYPNREVRRAFESQLLQAFSPPPEGLQRRHINHLRKSLEEGKLEEFFVAFQVFFANIPYDIQIRQEKYYQSIFFLVFTLLGWHMEAEVRTDHGRIDAVAATADRVYVFEFKLDGSAEEALAQIRGGDYARKYRGGTHPVKLVGVAFDSIARNLGAWLAADA